MKTRYIKRRPGKWGNQFVRCCGKEQECEGRLFRLNAVPLSCKRARKFKKHRRQLERWERKSDRYEALARKRWLDTLEKVADAARNAARSMVGQWQQDPVSSLFDTLDKAKPWHEMAKDLGAVSVWPTMPPSVPFNRYRGDDQHQMSLFIVGDEATPFNLDQLEGARVILADIPGLGPDTPAIELPPGGKVPSFVGRPDTLPDFIPSVEFKTKPFRINFSKIREQLDKIRPKVNEDEGEEEPLKECAARYMVLGNRPLGLPYYPEA